MAAGIVAMAWTIFTQQAHPQTLSGGAGPQAPLRSVVAALPLCGVRTEGIIYEVTDALLPAALAIVAGSGAVRVLVFCDGTNWVVL